MPDFASSFSLMSTFGCDRLAQESKAPVLREDATELAMALMAVLCFLLVSGGIKRGKAGVDAGKSLEI